jgi:hypothetical protein
VTPRGPAELGATLVELSVALLVGALVASMMAVWASSVGRAEREHRAEDAVMGELRYVKELLSKDLRSARGFFTTEPDTVSLWLDADRDGEVGVGETVTWDFGSGGALTRQVDETEAGIEADDLVLEQSGFAYVDALPDPVHEVSFTLVATFDEGGSVQERGVAATVAVRNSGGSA